ncbi:MAG: C-terminal binding protein [Planctomycetaceae bacterium]|nr:C-terminal binding protein [Planctomycetaceae bacterium]
MSVVRVLLTDLPWGNSDIEREGLSAVGAEAIIAPDKSEETLVNLAAGVDAIVTCWARVSRKVLDAAPNCRIVARLGIGLDNIDVSAATGKGMLVTNVPDYCVSEVADHTVALLLALSRNVGFYHLRTKRGEYDLQAGPPIRRLSSQTLGLIGLGRIGSAVAERARALQMTLLAHTRSGDSHGTGCRMVDLPTLLDESDYISLHVPATTETRRLINSETLQQVRPGARLINTSRGALIDPDALWEAIQSGRISGAGLDVFEPEPPDLSHPLYCDERVIATPHTAFVSAESLDEMRRRVVAQVVSVLRGVTPENVVNPEVHRRSQAPSA